MKKLFLFILIFSILIIPANALRQKGIFIYNDNICPECNQYKEVVRQVNVRRFLNINFKTIEGNKDGELDMYYNECEVDKQFDILPLIYFQDFCVIGRDNIKIFLDKIENEKDVLGIYDSYLNISNSTDNLPVANPGVPIEEAKKNTLIFVGLTSLSMLLLVLFGYAINSKKRKNSINILLIILLSAIFPFTQIIKTYAFCPVCTVAVGAGLGFAQYLGIDDLISSIWIGGLLLSITLWTIEWLKKKKWNFKFYKIVIFLIFYSLVILPFISSNTIGNVYNRIFGLDKVLLGIVSGTLGFSLGMLLSDKLSKKLKVKSVFPFQKVVIPITMLILLTLISYFLVY